MDALSGVSFTVPDAVTVTSPAFLFSSKVWDAAGAAVPVPAAWAEDDAPQAPRAKDMAQTMAKPAAVNAAAVCDRFMMNLLIFSIYVLVPPETGLFLHL
jgi:hypothetical protein